MMINYAISAFIIGIGIYLSFVCVYNLDSFASQQDSRNVFVCFLISLSFCGCFYALPLITKLLSDTFTSFRTGHFEHVHEDSNFGPRTPYERNRPSKSTALEPLYSALAATVEAQENCAAATRRLMLQYKKSVDFDVRRPSPDAKIET
jgi:hypothetical protein